MSNLPRRYRFATPAQWQSGLFHLASRQSGKGLEPLRPFDRTPELIATPGASAPTPLLTRELLWRGDAGQFHRLSAAGDVDTFAAPNGVATSPRLVADFNGLWAIGGGSLLCYEPETMSRLAAVEFPGARLVDLTPLTCDTLGILADTGSGWSIFSVGRDGNVLASTPLTGIHHAVGCAFLRRAQLLVVLTGGQHPRLYWFSVDGGAPKFSLPVSLLLPCCQCRCLAGAADDRIYVSASSAGQHVILVLDADGTLVDTVPVAPADAPVTGIAATTTNLYATGPRGLLRYSTAGTVPAGAAEVNCSFLTPALDSPDPEGASPWLRAELLTVLPEGCGVEIAVASTNDLAVRDQLAATAADPRLSPNQRIQKILNEPDIWQPGTSFQGGSSTTLSAPLFAVTGRFLWVYVTLTAHPGSTFPAIGELNVLYPGHGLMENLPAVYRQDNLGAARNEARPDSFVRHLVGVLEATTQGQDASISSLGSNIHPATAPEEWLNYIARWLGLPWDDALTLQQKRALVLQGPELARKRGTRAGLEILLQCLFPGTPPRFRVVDTTADFGFAVLACESAPGTALPALLGGFPRGRAELGPRSILGVMRLPCPNQPDDPTSRSIGKVRVDIAATAAARKAWEPWILAVLSAMVPATVTLVLRWIPPYALKPNTLGGNLILESAPVPHLGADAVTGLARLPESKPRLSQTGLTIGARLR